MHNFDVINRGKVVPIMCVCTYARAYIVKSIIYKCRSIHDVAIIYHFVYENAKRARARWQYLKIYTSSY